MDEGKFSAYFRMYNVEGLQVNFTVRADDAASHLDELGRYLVALKRQGYRVTEPVGDARPKLLQVVGFVVGTYEDKQRGQYMPCVHLYGQYGDFKQITVYTEKLALLPVKWEDAKVYDSTAPDRETARKRGYWHDCNFVAVLEPMLDQDGNPLTTDKGNIRYKFAGVHGADPDSIHVDDVPELDPDPSPPPQATNGNGKQVAHSDNPFNDPPIEEPAFKAQIGKIHALLGTIYSKAEIDEARHRLVSWATNKRTTSSKELTATEAKRLIEALEQKVREMNESRAQAA